MWSRPFSASTDSCRNTEFPKGSLLFLNIKLLSQSSQGHTWDNICIYSESSAITVILISQVGRLAHPSHLSPRHQHRHQCAVAAHAGDCSEFKALHLIQVNGHRPTLDSVPASQVTLKWLNPCRMCFVGAVCFSYTSVAWSSPRLC